MAELLLRYGWSYGWERLQPRASELGGPPSVVSHFAPNGREFLPSLRWVADPAAIGAGEWEIRPPRPRTWYAPPYATFDRRPLTHQLAVFRRGDSAVVVAAFALPPDSVPADAQVAATLVVAPDEGAAPSVARAAATGRTGVLRVAAPETSVVVSIEAVASGRRAVRARYGARLARPAAGVGVSDLLLLADADSQPAALDDAVRRARPSLVVVAPERLTIYWEVYGLAEAALPLDVSLALLPPKAGWFRRAAERLSLKNPASPILLRWQERPHPTALLGRALAIDVPKLPPGRYTLRLTVTPPGGPPAVAERVVEVVKHGE
jgi:hypothetical protein